MSVAVAPRYLEDELTQELIAAAMIETSRAPHDKAMVPQHTATIHSLLPPRPEPR